MGEEPYLSLVEMARRYVVIDNGAYRIKYGYSTDNNPRSIPNCTAKILKSMQSFIGDEIDQIQNTSQLSLSRPFDRGYLTNWNIEKEVAHQILLSLSFSLSLSLSLSSICFHMRLDIATCF